MRERFDSSVRFAPKPVPFRGPDVAALDWTDDDRTVMGVPPRSEPNAPEDATDELVEAQLNLAVRSAQLVDLLDALAGEPWAGSVVLALQTRAREIETMVDAVLTVCKDADDWRMAILLQIDAPLTEYLRGVLAWADGVVRALTALTNQLALGSPDWAAARQRINEASAFYLDERVDVVLADAAALGLRPQVTAHRHLEELFWAASWLETTLTARVQAA